MNFKSDSVEIDLQVMFFIASEDHEVWIHLIGHEVGHFTFGSGKVVDVNFFPNESPSICVQFYGDQSTREFFVESFSDGKFSSAYISAESASEIEERQAEAKARIEQAQLEKEAIDQFNTLKANFLISWYREDRPISILHKILLQLESGEAISNRDIGWLKSQKLYPPIAFFYESQFHKTGDLWDCVLSSSHWRKAGYPQRAVNVTEGISSSESRLLSAVLTTRGGAFRDLKDLDQAEENAKKAMELTPRSYYPHNLMGSIKFQLGDPESGEEYFSKALQLGSPIAEQDNAIFTAVEAANPQQQEVVARYLLTKDRNKYRWAERYVSSGPSNR